MQLAVGLHLSAEKDALVRKIVDEVALTNRDPHLLFNQVGQKAGLIPSAIVSSAFISLWSSGNTSEVDRVSAAIRKAL
jgi:hypothetical protein